MTLKFSILLSLLTPLATLGLSGCHCWEVSEQYGDVIDCTADHQLTLDRFYRPGLDLTRICQNCKSSEEFAQHTAIYPDCRVPRSVPSEPGIPQVPPVERMEPLRLPELSPIPPVPAANTLPVFDTATLKEISAAPPTKVPSSKESSKNNDSQALGLRRKKAGVGGVQHASQQTLQKETEPSTQQTSKRVIQALPHPENSLQPSEDVKTLPRPMVPVSTPAGVPASQKFYLHSSK